MVLPSDEILMAGFARGDQASFEKLAARYGPALDAFFRRRLPDDGRAEELCQETLMALYALGPSYVEKGRFRALVFSIAYRKLATSMRAGGSLAGIPGRIEARSEPEILAVRQALLSLSEPIREALLLTFFEGLNAAEAGQVLSCSAEAVRARVCRAKSALARKLSPQPRPKR